jgi:hypothetical protein
LILFGLFAWYKYQLLQLSADVEAAHRGHRPDATSARAAGQAAAPEGTAGA